VQKVLRKADKQFYALKVVNIKKLQARGERLSDARRLTAQLRNQAL
jgi:hypothetical protein